MDPDTNLNEQSQLLGSYGSKARLRTLRVALHDWLKGGGFPPVWSAHPEATRAYRAWERKAAKFQDLWR